MTFHNIQFTICALVTFCNTFCFVYLFYINATSETYQNALRKTLQRITLNCFREFAYIWRRKPTKFTLLSPKFLFTRGSSLPVSKSMQNWPLTPKLTEQQSLSANQHLSLSSQPRKSRSSDSGGYFKCPPKINTERGERMNLIILLLCSA